MKVTRLLSLVLGFGLYASQMQACPIVVTNDQSYGVFITDPHSGRAILIGERWLKGILPRSSMTIDPSLTGLQKWMSKVKLSHEKLDFWVENRAAKNGAEFYKKFELTQYYCAGTSKLAMSELEKLVKNPTDHWSVETFAPKQQTGKSCKVTFVNDIKSNVFVTDPSAQTGILVERAGLLSSSTSKALAANDTLDVYVEKETANEFYLKYQISFKQCTAQGLEIKLSALKSLIEKPAHGISVKLLQENKIVPQAKAAAAQAPKKAVAKAAATMPAQTNRASVLGDTVEDQLLREAAPHCEKMPLDMQEQCYYASQVKEEALDY